MLHQGDNNYTIVLSYRQAKNETLSLPVTKIKCFTEFMQVCQNTSKGLGDIMHTKL